MSSQSAFAIPSTRIRYSNGEIMLVSPDMRSNGFGQPWGHTRSYSNQLSANPDNVGVNGAGWFIRECPILANLNPSPTDPNQATIVILGVVSEAIWFDYDSGTATYQARFFVPDTLVHNGSEFVYVDAEGRQFKFYDFSGTPEALRGQFKSFVNPYGQETAAAYGVNNLISSFTQEGTGSSSSSGVAGPSTSYLYNYNLSGENAGRLSTVTLLNGIFAVRRTQFKYYGSGESHGSLGDLQSAKLQQFNGTSWDNLSTTYYRYYKAGDTDGFVRGLKYLVSSNSYSQMVALGIVPETASDEQIALFADRYFEFDSSQRVTLMKVAGTYAYEYSYSPSANADEYNNWKMKTTETLPDGNVNIVYTNFAGQVMFKIFQSGASQWYKYYKYDGAGRVIVTANSSAVSSYTESSAGLVTLKDSDGLLRMYDYYTSSGSGAVAGYLQDEKVKQGAGTGTSAILIRAWQYVTQSDGTNSVSPVWKETLYQSDASGGSNPAVTEYDYDWFGTSLQMQQRTTILPVISTGQNGDGNTYSREEVFDAYGRVTWQQDELGFLTRTQFDDATGAVLQTIQDVDTSIVTDAPPGWATPSGGGLNLITDYSIDKLGRETQSLGPLHDVDLAGTNTAVRRANWTIYQDILGQICRGAGCLDNGSGTYTLINPVQITISNGLGQVTDQISAQRARTNGVLLASDTFPQSTWSRWQSSLYGQGGILSSRRLYHIIPFSGAGISGANYSETTYLFDVMRRQVRMEAPGATITRSVLSPQGWFLETWVGTNDNGATNSDPSGGGAPSNNMVQVNGREYDGGPEEGDKGDGNLTKLTQWVDSSTTRVVLYDYDFRNRLINTDGEINYYQTTTYDNQDRVVEVNRYDTNTSGHLITRRDINYDDLGRVYQTIDFGVDPGTGTVGNSLTRNTWRDGAGNLIKQRNAGSNAFTKSFYDGVRRLILQYTGYSIASPTAGDIVMLQGETTYDAASNAIEMLVRERFHDAPATAVGELTDPSGADPKARVSYMAFWPDPLGRTVATANYGTCGGGPLSRPDTIPAGSSTVLLTTTTYNDRGEANLITDPAGMVTESGFDDAGRIINEVQDYSVSPGHLNRRINYTYNADGKLAILNVHNETTGDQVTIYTYGTTLSASDIASNDYLVGVKYPDSTGPSDQVTFSYNRQGQTKLMTDQLGTAHVLEYDLLGRQIHDRVTTLGSGVDGSIRRISMTYEVRGMLQNVTSYNNATVGSGSVVNDVQHAYNSFSQLTTQYQSHLGAVNTSSTPSVQYAYADGSDNTIRPTSTTYPNGRVINLNYGTSGAMNDQLSRIGSLIDSDSGSTHLADYTYVGLNRTVRLSSPEPVTELTYILQGSESPGDGGDQYTGWDRFTRVIDQRWILTGTTTTLERIQYGFDRADNRQYRANMVASSGQDEYYTYDTLYQLLTLQRGTLNTSRTGITGTPGREEHFTFDPTGNWDEYVTKVSGTTTLNQGRTHNKVNEVTALNGSSTFIGENAVGNIILAPQTTNWLAGYNLTYDAWNRLVTVSTSGTSSGSGSGSPAVPTTVAAYAYDGLNHRVSKTTSVTRHYYYTAQWQIVEERTGTSTSAERQFVWGLRYLDDLVLRDLGTQRFYALHDYFNCTAIVDTTGTVQERYGYNAFGQGRVMDGSFASRTTSLYTWETMYGGYRWDSETGFYQVRNRYLHPTLGRWLTRDPIGYQGGINLYAYVENRSLNRVDYFGLESGDCCICDAPVLQSTTTALQGNYTWNSYVNGNWGVNNHATTGQIGLKFGVQEIAPFAGKENCGVSQTVTIQAANNILLNNIRKTANNTALVVGSDFPDINLNVADPFTQIAWFPRYKDGQITFFDAPGGFDNDAVGSIVFDTCFISKDKSNSCENDRCCVVWQLDVDFAAYAITLKVTPLESYCIPIQQA